MTSNDHSALLEKYSQFSPLEARDRPMIADLEDQITKLNKEYIQHLASQLTHVHEKHNIYTDKESKLKGGYEEARQLKTSIGQAENAALSRNTAYQQTLDDANNANTYNRILTVIYIVLFIICAIVTGWLC